MIRTDGAPRWLALAALLYAARVVWAALLALPLYGALLSRGVEHLPFGDAHLFEQGGVYLVEALRLSKTALSASAPLALFLLLLGLMFNVLPGSAMVHAVADRGARVSLCYQRALASFPRFVLLGGIGFALQCLALLLGVAVALWARTLVSGGSGAVSGELTFAAVTLLALLSMTGIGIVIDLARAASIQRPGDLWQGLQQALRCVSAGRIRLLSAWAAPFAVVLMLTLLTGYAVGALQLEKAGAWRWLLALLLHHGVLLAACVAELAWQHRALALLKPLLQEQPLTAPATVDTISGSGVPHAPS